MLTKILGYAIMSLLLMYSDLLGYGGGIVKLSTRGRYGVKAMFDLAANQHNGPVSLKSIAERQNLSEAYLEQLFANLKKAGLVKSVRGAQGGYLLGDEAENITVGQILRTLEGTVAPVECVDDMNDGAEECPDADNCVTRFIWQKIRDSIAEVIDSITLQDMIERQ